MLTETEIAERVNARRAHINNVQEARSTPNTFSGRYVESCETAYDDLADALSGDDHRVRLGLGQIDILTRGFGPKELILLLGFAHAGKTQLVNTTILNNLDRRILFFSMDDPREMILLKLACMSRGESAEVVERRLRDGDDTLKRELRSFATTQLENLLIVDQSLGLAAMSAAVDEATVYWGAAPELVILDFLGSMRGNGQSDDEDGGIKAKIDSLKAWVKDKPFPTICLHQNTRGRGAPGEPITMLSGAYGGEQEATMVLGIRRKRDWRDLDEWQRREHDKTVTVHLVKNKRPPGRKTPDSGLDFYMDPDTGLIRTLRDSDLIREQMTITTPEQAVRAVEELRADQWKS